MKLKASLETQPSRGAHPRRRSDIIAVPSSLLEATCDSRPRASFSDCLLRPTPLSPARLFPFGLESSHSPNPLPTLSPAAFSSAGLDLGSILFPPSLPFPLSPRRTAVPQPLLLLPSFFPLKVPPVAFFRPAAKLDGASVLHASSSSSFSHSPGHSFSLPSTSCWLGLCALLSHARSFSS